MSAENVLYYCVAYFFRFWADNVLDMPCFFSGRTLVFPCGRCVCCILGRTDGTSQQLTSRPDDEAMSCKVPFLPRANVAALPIPFLASLRLLQEEFRVVYFVSRKTKN